MVALPPPARVAVVVHPSRPIDGPLKTLERWSAANGVEMVQIAVVGSTDRQVLPPAELAAGDLIVALGGDGTVLSALRASALVDAPVLGVACGSLGALSAVRADGLASALERVQAGDWIPHRLPALSIHPANADDEWALNDFVVVRHGAGQAVVELAVDGELYVRLAGDGVIVASPLGSSAYSMAAGGPVLTSPIRAIVATPLAMHGGSAPPLVIPATSTLRVQVHPSFAGFEVEIDGHNYPAEALDYQITLAEDKVTLVSFDGPGLGLAGLRARGLITDSPRVLARDDRLKS